MAMVDPDTEIRYYEWQGTQNQREVNGAQLFYDNHVYARALNQWVPKIGARQRIKEALKGPDR
jgi:hypothetical protein